MTKEKSLIDLTSDLLTEEAKDEVVKNLLKPHKTIRDAVHGDFRVTRLEVDIIDTKEFQRLHKIKQLGPTYLVYPCAKHTRFEHSLGTSYMTQRLIELILKNPYKDLHVPIYVNLPSFNVRYPSSTTYSKALITNYHILLARICALLHDLAHIPFGHTLENEGFLFKEQWNDEKRVKYFLGDNSTIGKIIVDTLNKKGLDGKNFLKEVKNMLTAETEEEIERLPYPFISDIINNTICADLLDYVKRDIYFCGLKEAYDERFLIYFYVGMYNKRPRLILRLIKPSKRTIRRDVLSETLHLLRLRYSIAEKVYYHHTKISASAMIISAVNSAIENNVISKQKLFEIGDDQLLTLLKKDNIGKYIINNLEERRLYKSVYKLKYTEPILGDSISPKKYEIIESFKDRKYRYNKERALEKMNRLKSGQIVIYCPSHEMGQKAVRTLVNWGSKEPGPLENIDDDHIRSEIKSSIIDKHLALWNMYVFVDPDLSKEEKVCIASDCAKEIFPNNEIEDNEYRQNRSDYLDRFRELAEEEFGITVSSREQREIKQRVGRSVGLDRFRVIGFEEYIKQIKKE